MTTSRPGSWNPGTATRRRRNAEQQRRDSRSLYLKSIGCRIDLLDALTRPALTALISEDLCWRIASEAAGVRPPLWQRARRASWRADFVARHAMRTRIVELAVAAGLPVPPLTVQDWVGSR